MRVALYCFVVFFSAVSMSGYCAVTLSLSEPVDDFVTNNAEITVEGEYSSTFPGAGVLTIVNISGMRQVPQSGMELQEITFRLDSEINLSSIHLVCAEDQGRLLAPRRISLKFSTNGNDFTTYVEHNVTTNTPDVESTATIWLRSAVRARYVMMEITDAWQAGGVKIKEIYARDKADNVHYALIRSASFRVFLDRTPTLYSITVPLMAGENRLTMSAELSSPLATLPETETKDFTSLTAYRLESLRSIYESDQPITIGDGSNISVFIPPGAVENVEKIEINRTDRSGNDRLIASYDFRFLVKMPFTAQATSELETQPAFLAVDGDISNNSSWITGVTPMPVSITIDLRKIFRIGSVVIYSRVDDNKSYGPQEAHLYLSTDGRNFVKAVERDGFNQESTLINLPDITDARYARLTIVKSKEPNNVRIREIEFRDQIGTPIIAYADQESKSLRRPAVVTFRLDAAIFRDRDWEKLAVFRWDHDLRDWQLIGGELDIERRVLTVELTHLSEIGVFETEASRSIEPRWSLNPFSPNGDGVADVTRMTIEMPHSASGDYGELIFQIFNLSGMLVKTLVDREMVVSRFVSVQWDGTDSAGRVVPIGPYIYQIKTRERTSRGLIVVAK